MAEKTAPAWNELFAAHPEIMRKVERTGLCEVSAKTIKQFREPRLMTKHDSIDGVPVPLKERGLNILAISRSAYVLGDFEVFEALPDTADMRPEFRDIPTYETLDIDHISSESNAINALVISDILDDFLGEQDTVETFNGRMGTGNFDFEIARHGGGHSHIEVNGAQLEIDGGFENWQSVIIMEAKNVLHPDFNVRQLYYPYRKYSAFVRQPIRLLFSQYTNLTYHLFEYEFQDPRDYSSIKLVRKKAYTFEDSRISADDVWYIWNGEKVIFDDDRSKHDGLPPFPQADKVERILSLVEFLSGRPDGAATDEITEFMGTVERQAAYYPSAGIYLGLFEKPKLGTTRLTDEAWNLLKLRNRSDRLLRVAQLMFRHKIFHDLYGKALKLGNVPDKNDVVAVMVEMNVIEGNSESMLYRRAQTVIAWLRWLFELPDEE